MSDTDNQALIDAPHGVQENIKMELLGLIHEGADPFEIIYAVAKYLESASAERGYAQHIIDNIRTIYGIALNQPKPLRDEIKELELRRQRILDYLENTAKDDTVTDDERARLGFAEKAQLRKIEKLKTQLEENDN